MVTSLLYQKGKTLKKVSKEQALKTAAFVAVFGITGIVAYAATRAYKSIMDIGIEDEMVFTLSKSIDTE